MKSLRAASLLSIAFLASATAHSTRKSLGFGPSHPTARYVTEPQITGSFAAHTDPFDVARAFLQSYTDSDYFIREDSYTDKTTGVTHVYVRQRVDGLEVANGDINLNIRDGIVMSYGDSFFGGSSPEASNVLPTTSHATHCYDFGEAFMKATTSDQLVMENQEAVAESHLQNCRKPLAAVRAAGHADSGGDSHDPRRAALYFMIAAHPESSTAHDLASNFDATVDKMTVAYEHHFAGQDTTPTAVISGLPGTVNPVKARVVYVQTPTEDNSTELHATWRFEVEMSDNWYEAYVSAEDPSSIVSVVDWASDSPMPRTDGKLNALEAKLAMGKPVRAYGEGPDKYKVWKWGINDPEWGKRTVEPASFDTLASPLGWHTISKANNPAGSPDWVGKNVKDHGATYLNFTTTWGNNVFAHENWEGRNNWISNYRPDGGEALDFTFKYGAKEGTEKNPRDYIDVA
ncbi:Fungalysin/Thermolysin Extracellular metalloproteinase 5, partial [Ceratobasidium sp. 392]